MAAPDWRCLKNAKCDDVKCKDANLATLDDVFIKCVDKQGNQIPNCSWGFCTINDDTIYKLCSGTNSQTDKCVRDAASTKRCDGTYVNQTTNKTEFCGIPYNECDPSKTLPNQPQIQCAEVPNDPPSDL